MNKPTAEQVQIEATVAMSLRKQYGTNQPTKTYEDGVAEALLWVLGNGKKPNDIEA